MSVTQYSLPNTPVIAQPVIQVDGGTGNTIAAYNNLDGITLLSQVAIGSNTFNSLNQTNANARGCKVYLNISAIGTGNVTVTIKGFDPVTNTSYTLLASTAVSAVGFTVLEVYPGVTATANASASTTLPRTWNVSAVAALSVGTVSFTVSASLVV